MGKRKINDWPALIAEYKVSDDTVEEFCSRKDIHPNTFYRNKKKYQSNNSALVRVPVKSPIVHQQARRIQINNFILKIPEGVDPKTLETTLRILKDVACS